MADRDGTPGWRERLASFARDVDLGGTPDFAAARHGGAANIVADIRAALASSEGGGAGRTDDVNERTPTQGATDDAAADLGEADREVGAHGVRDGADSHDVGVAAAEVMPAAEEGGRGHRPAAPPPAAPSEGEAGGSIAAWQARAAEWTDTRFPTDTLKDRGLILGEEAGEVQRCIVKGDQDIRGGAEHWRAELRKESVDVFFALVALAHRAGFSLQDVIADRWAEIDAKTFPKGTSAAAAPAVPGGGGDFARWREEPCEACGKENGAHLHQCPPAAPLPGGGLDREAALRALNVFFESPPANEWCREHTWPLVLRRNCIVCIADALAPLLTGPAAPAVDREAVVAAIRDVRWPDRPEVAVAVHAGAERIASAVVTALTGGGRDDD